MKLNHGVKIVLMLILVIIYHCFTGYIQASVIQKSFVDINVPAAIVMDSESGRVLFEKNAQEKRPMASLTKIMTSILLVENCKMDEMIEVPKEAVWIGGSEVGLKKGDKVSAQSLLYGMLLPSGNDCAYTVGLHLGGTIENFAEMMTKKAKVIGAQNTSFANPHGLDHENHFTTAYDMALITKYAMKNKYINEAMNTKTITVNFGSFTKTLNNTNALLRTYDKADGGKTGFTNGANRCLVVTAHNDESRYIAVVLGAETTSIRFTAAKEILEACFQKYKKQDISDYLHFYIHIPVEKGSIKSYEKSYTDQLSLPLTAEEYEAIYIKQYVEPKLDAPVVAGTQVGIIEAYIDDEKIYERKVYLDQNIQKKNIWDYMKEGLTNIFKPMEVI